MDFARVLNATADRCTFHNSPLQTIWGNVPQRLQNTVTGKQHLKENNTAGNFGPTEPI